MLLYIQAYDKASNNRATSLYKINFLPKVKAQKVKIKNR